ncbi:MAG: hypothetical protein ACRYFR_01305 [Janthinobacterium lividum]
MITDSASVLIIIIKKISVSRQVISRLEHIKLFFYEYYLGRTAWVKWLRIFGGPLMILIGVQFYRRFEVYSSTHKAAVAFGGFSFLYGVYYILKPVMMLSILWRAFKTVGFSVILDEKEIQFQNNEVLSAVQLSAFNKIWRSGNYHLLKLTENTTFYLRANQLTEKEEEILNRHLDF